MLRKVWEMKKAAEEETRQFASPADYFRHIRRGIPDLGLPTARPGPRPAAADSTGST
jgi:hypothetical protein